MIWKKRNIGLLIFSLILLWGFKLDVMALNNLNSEYQINNINQKVVKNDYFMDGASKPSIKSVSVVNGADVILVVVNQGSYPIAGYYIGTSFNSSQYYQTSATSAYFSVMNGTQNVWVKDSAGNVAGPYPIVITKSCNEQPNVKNATGAGDIEKCYIYANNSYKPLSFGEIVTCADGYSLQYFNRSNYCTSVNNNSLSKYGLTHQYCSNVFHYKCVKNNSEPNSVTSYLSNLSLSSGTLSPAFKASTYNYSTSVNVSAITINASLNSDGSSFVDGYGSRTVKLNYGTNTIYVKVKSKTGNITTYTIKITRIDNRSKDNLLSSLSVSVGSLEPGFSASTTNYNVSVPYEIASIRVDATISDSKSSFVNDFAPRTVNLNEGNNAIQIKVKSQSGATKTYTVNVNRASNTVTSEPTDQSSLALLSSLELSEGNITFDAKTFEYTVYVNYEVTQVIANAKAANNNDIVTISGGDNLEVGIESQILVKVEDNVNNYSRVYTINIIRKEEDNQVSANSEVKDIVIKNHDIDFEQSKEEYKVFLDKNEKELDITVTPEDSKSTVTIDGNKNLKMGSKITITITAEDGSVTNYYVVVDGIKKGTNMFLVVVLIILIVLVIGYIVLRLLGYKVYFNFSLIGSFFRAIVEKIRNIFDR